MRVLEGHSDVVMALAFAPDGSRLVSAGWDGTIRVWDPRTGRTERTMRTANERALAVAYSPDGKYLAAGFRHNNAPGAYNRGYGTVAWFPAAPRLGEDPDTISAGDTWFADEQGVRGVVFSPDGRTLGTLGTLGSGSFAGANVILWDVEKRKERVKIATGSRLTQAIAYRPDGAALAAVSPEMGEGLFVWRLSLDRHGPYSYHRKPRLLRYPDDRGWALAYSRDGHTLAAAFDSGRVAWWQPGSGAPAVVREAHRGAAAAVCFSPDNRFLLSAGNDGLIHLWDNASYNRVCTYDWQLGDIGCLAFAPDGLTAVAGGNGPILLWDIEG